MLTTLRNTAPHVPEYRHALGRFSFRTVYADPSNKGRFSQKDLGMVYSRDILGEPGSLQSTAPRLLEDFERSSNELNDREKEERTLEELRFVPGDFLLVAVLLPKNVTLPSELSIKGSGAGAIGASAGATSSAAWRTNAAQSGALGKGDNGWGRSLSSLGPGTSRGGGHWRGESNAPSTRGRGGGGRGGGGDFGRDRNRDRDRDRDIDRNDRVPPPRRNEPPSPRGGNEGRGDRGGRRGRGVSRSRSWSRSHSPPTRRRNRYD